MQWVYVILALWAQAPQPRPMPLLPLTQLDERAVAADFDNRTFSLAFAQPVPIRDLLLLLVRGTSLSVVPDPDLAGTFIGELKNVTVRQALDFILRPLGLSYRIDGQVVRVFAREPETRIFDLNYIAAARTSSTTVSGDGALGTVAALSTTSSTDVFDDLTNGVRSLLSQTATFNVDRKAGLLQATDFPERLDRVSLYLDAVQDRVHRQVQIDGLVVEVELNDEKAKGIDWTALAAQLSGSSASGQRPATRRSLTGLRVTDSARLLTLLAEQGTVTTLASHRLLTMNNEPALVRSEVVVFSVTPQISSDAVVTLSVSPIVKAPIVAESDMLARVVDGETLVVSGFTRDRETRERRAVGRTGGWFGRSTVVTRKRVEVVILLTPRIATGSTAQ